MTVERRGWKRWMGGTGDALERGRAVMVIATCLGLVVAIAALILVWLISGDLEPQTVILGLIVSLVLAGIALLARSGRTRAAAWSLIALLTVLNLGDVAMFGLGSPSASAHLIAIVLAACGLGLRAGLGVALFASASVWLTAIAAGSGWYEPYIAYEVSHLTFDAPFFTVLFFLIALIAGSWSGYVGGLVRERGAGE